MVKFIVDESGIPDSEINLMALFSGGDPFAPATGEKEVPF